MGTISKQVQGQAPFRPTGLVPLNRDANDGLITAMNKNINGDFPRASNGVDPECPADWSPTLCFLAKANFNPNDTEDTFGEAVLNFLPAPDDLLTLDSTLTNEQRALLGCGPYYGTRCDSASRDDTDFALFGAVICNLYGSGCTQGGGVDFLNMEASALVQSFVGFEGTDLSDSVYTSNPDHPEYAQWAAGSEYFDGPAIWRTTSGLPQPGTIEFVGGPVCTRFMRGRSQPIVLPGCRGANAVLNRAEAGADPTKTTPIVFQFDDGYDPAIDGCVLASTIDGIPVRGQYSDGTSVDLSTCFEDSDSKVGLFFEISPQSLRQLSKSVPTSQIAGPGVGTVKPGARTLWHPYAGCFGSAAEGGPAAAAIDGSECLITLTDAEIDELQAQGLVPSNILFGLRQFPGDPDGRSYESDFFSDDINSQSQIFRSEMAAFSWNFQQFLVQTSCNAEKDDIENDPECFDPKEPFTVGKCSWATPQYCSNVKGFFGAAGVLRNTVRAGGNGQFGRRTFLWHSGGELVLRYQRRNVFGFSMDFGEDTTKSNWGVEFTWISKQNYIDNNDFNDNLSQSGVLNLTVSVDRPTFINFLNQNRTFFINSQWFFQYFMNPEYDAGWLANGNLNVLFTVAIFTGYFQDRLEPQLVTVYDFGSRSGALLPSVRYRFTEAFSAGVGLGFFFGRTQLVDMPQRSFAPAGNRAGPDAYKDGADNVLSLFRDKDEVWMKLRWTF
jgi:hypothetical protein